MRRGVRGALLGAGMALGAGMTLFCFVNALAAPWTFVQRSRLALAALTLLAFALMLALGRGALRRGEALCRRAGTVRLMAVLFFAAAQLFYGAQMRFVPGSDCAVCYYGALEWADGGAISEATLDTLAVTPHNFGLLMLDTLILRAARLVVPLAGQDLYYAVMAANVACFAAGLWALLRAAERARGGVMQALLALGMALCLPMSYCAAELYTDALCMPFLMLALSALFGMLTARSERRAHALAALAGVAVLLGMEIRATVAILAVAACVVAALRCGPRRMLCLATMLAVLLAGHGAWMRVRDGVIGAERLRQMSLPTTHWMGMGIPDPYGYSHGEYSAQDYAYAISFADPNERAAACAERLHERLYALRTPGRMLSALSRKALFTFGDGTFDLDSVFDSISEAPPWMRALLMDDTAAHRAYTYATTALLLAQLLLAALGMIALARAPRPDAPLALCAVATAGLLLFLCVWESNPRYFFHFMPVLLALAAHGQEALAAQMGKGRERA